MKPTAKTIFESLCDLTPEAREAELDRLCGDDSDLRTDVESLLQSADAAGDFMLDPTIDTDSQGSSGNSSALAEGPGTIIDRYKLLEQIGVGGFGVVYMAQQSEPIRRRVALKVIKLGMDTKQVIARFDAERQALAMMDHPNIAGVFDGGSTETGRPYFVMELVKGDPITQFCDQHRLPLRERLGLFTQVCHAIQHAHQKGVIHRDIKPSNVLVTTIDDKPVVKVIDFGIAKATNCELTQKTLFTEFRQLIGTPQYMSPEQAQRSGVDVDTRTDIYSLGVLLYEMLTGKTPLDPKALNSAGWAEMQRMIVEDEPSRPSVMVSSAMGELTEIAGRRSTQPTRLGGLLRGDLDWIVLKTLDKERSRRYASAGELAADIDRYLSDQPVEATPPSRRNQLRKFARRNKGVLATTAIVFVTLSIGLVATAVAAKAAIREQDRAQAALQQAEENFQTAQQQQRRATRAAIAAGASLTLPDNEAKALAASWRHEFQSLPAAERIAEQTRFAAWYSGWLLSNNRPGEAKQVVDEFYAQAKASGVRNATFLSLANSRIYSLARTGGNPQQLADTYTDLVDTMVSINGADFAIKMYPELAAVYVGAGREKEAVTKVQAFLDAFRDRDEPISAEINQRLDVSLSGLAIWSKTRPELYRQLKQMRDSGTVVDQNAEFADDREQLQGHWFTAIYEGDQLVEQMDLIIEGNTSTTQFTGPDGVTSEARSGTFRLWRSGGVKVLTSNMGGAHGRSVSFVYAIENGKLFTVSGLLSNENSLPQVKLYQWERKRQPGAG